MVKKDVTQFLLAQAALLCPRVRLDFHFKTLDGKQLQASEAWIGNGNNAKKGRPEIQGFGTVAS